ncbi:hypothetical protein CISIN_1g045413mg, partial [Citrus sinensis]
PWIVSGHYLTVQLWSPHFDSSNEKIDKITALIRLPSMPLHYYHKKIIRMLGHVIGKIIKIDCNTELATRGKFAHIAVEVSLESPLISQFLLDGRIQRVEYEALPTICFGCAKYRHTSSSCLDKLILEARGEKMNDMASGPFRAPHPVPPKPNPNEEPLDIGDRDMDKVDEDSSDGEYMEELEDDESETSDESQFFVEEDNMDVNQQGVEPLE